MKKKNKFKKRLFWNMASLCPKWIREKIVRSRFKIDRNLNSDIVFKLATTKEDIEQALNLVYDAYINLNYIDKNSDQLHLPKYLILPTTTILVIKLKEKVIGTVSIILDSSLGLPSETTWDISEYKKNGMSIGEISALTISKDMRSHAGQLFLPLIKMQHIFCKEFLNLDGVVAATSQEVEAFYTDLLLFKPIANSRGRKHDLVKGNKSSCCFLDLNDPMKKRYEQAYSHREPNQNLHHFFFQCETPNIQFPPKMISIQALLQEKNQAMMELLKEKPHLFTRFSDKDKLIISNLEPGKQLASLDRRAVRRTTADRRDPRLMTTIQGRIEKKDLNISTPVKIVEVSQSGLKAKFLYQADIAIAVDDEISFKLEKRFSTSTFVAKVMWVEKDKAFGCVIQTKSKHLWRHFYETVSCEIQGTPDVVKQGLREAK